MSGLSVSFLRRFFVFLMVLAVIQPGGFPLTGSATGAPAEAETQKRGASGLPLPRYVSIKGNPVNLRRGPGTRYPALLTYRRTGWPVEILDENGSWRKIRDYDGDTGWIQGNLLRGKRSVILRRNPTAHKLRRRPEQTAVIRAFLQPGVVAALETCRMEWCDIRVKGFRGWVPRISLWGVYPHEFAQDGAGER